MDKKNHRDRTNDTLNQRTVPCTYVGMYILNNDLNTINEKMSTIDGGTLQEIVVSGNGTAKVNAQIKAIEVKSPNVSIDLW